MENPAYGSLSLKNPSDGHAVVPALLVAKPFYFAHHPGQMAVASSVEAKAWDKLVRVGFSNSYRGTTDDAAILRVTGESRNRWDRLRQTALPAQPHFAGRQTGRDADQRSVVL